MRRPQRDFELSTLPEILERLKRSLESLEVETVELVEADCNAIEQAVTRLDPA